MNKQQQIKPMKKYVAYGKGGIINASVWRQERKYAGGKSGYFENVSISRSYLDKDSNSWKSTNSYSMKEIEKLHAVLEQVLSDFNEPFEDAQEFESEVHEEPARPAVPDSQPQYTQQRKSPVHTKRGDVCVVY